MSCFQSIFENYVRASIPVVQVVTYEWQRLHGFSVAATHKSGQSLYVWSSANGLRKWDDDEAVFVRENEDELSDPEQILRWYMSEQQKGVLLLLEDFHPFITAENYLIVRLLREATRMNPDLNKTLVLQSTSFANARDLDKEVPLLELELPGAGVLVTILGNAVAELSYDCSPKSNTEMETIASASLGLSSVEAEWTYRKIIADKSRLTTAEIPLIITEKEQIIKKEGVLEYFHPQGGFQQVGGLDSLKSWLSKRGKAFLADAKQFGLQSPKGVLLLGIPGCGKSLVSKTIANEWNLPLLKFDLGKVFAGIVGESESNIRKALSLAETIAPSILWVDEIEKGLSGLNGGGDSGTSARVFGTLLTWMQEKQSEVFVIATANNISCLPPELLRKGRFDEIFFVDLPSQDERKTIFRIHISKRKRNPEDFAIERLAEAAAGYSGAEIEEAVSEGLFLAYSEETELSDRHILASLKASYPLSKTMRGTIEELRKWAKVRARLASNEGPEAIPAADDCAVPVLKQEKFNPFIGGRSDG